MRFISMRSISIHAILGTVFLCTLISHTVFYTQHLYVTNSVRIISMRSISMHINFYAH